MVRLAAFVAIGTAILAAAGPASGAARPGTIEAPIARTGLGEDVQALGATPDGRILVAGRSRLGGFTFVRAYRPDGTPDEGFGAGGEVDLGGEYSDVAAMVVQPDGRILIGQTGRATLRRLDPDGSVDTSFGTGGSIDVDLGPGQNFFFTVAPAPDGRIVVGGTPQGSPAVHVRRYLSNGDPDPGFGTNGQALVTPTYSPFYASVAVQPDGGIVVVIDGGNSEPRIARLAPDGTLDGGFGNGGVAPIELGRSRWREQVHAPVGLEWRPLALRDGRIRMPVTFGSRERVSRVGVVGLTAAGHFDRSFGRRGLALGPRRRVPVGGEWPRVAVLDDRGSILLTGSAASADDLSGEDATIVRRFRRDGTLDLSFGRRGLMRGTLGSTGGAFQQQLAMLDGNTAVLAEEDTTPKYQSWHGGAVNTLNAGYDRAAPVISLTTGCHWAHVRVRDISALDRVVVRVGRRVVRRTTRRNLRLRVRPGLRISVTAFDVAGNGARVGTTVQPC